MKLAPRQKQALELCMKGNRQHEIAEVMGCSVQNVKNLLTACYFKLNARNAAEAVAKAMQQGLVHLCILMAVVMGCGHTDHQVFRNRVRSNYATRIIRNHRNEGHA